MPFPDARPDDVAWPALVWPVPAGTRLGDAWVSLTAFDADRDAEALFAALDHDAVWAHVPGRPAHAEDLVRTVHERRDRLGWFPWVVRDARDGRVVGTSSYLDVSVPDARLEVGATAYAPDVWAGPVNPATKAALLGLAFDTLRAGRVQLKTDVRNLRSQRAIARLGATPEGVLRRYQRRADGTVRDTAVFSVTAEDWPRVRAGLVARLDGYLPRRG
ncbi:GNAT family N-acetyltransferase [Jannaschia sp. R86511]|uniref:GNAT family N-acetyltransferase n=1 Tax=Jannaschia sp. R86511 TaxID=3093853 RepID=UPI0036D403B9